ncbi:DUF397 domain-containing protein [Streptomyces sp. Z26]|uniref:DUF397 domain-containing protein n=1 Tax=Streptomyces TaxID=1883 RepID=UPI000EF144CF|nr:DUF397 domain-containing protein [Streptomyces sp. Z26]RLL67499.1 DUF397 domain-containing protein [Streptomyces sp. Z26]
MTTETPRWFTSSYSGNGGQCVEVATNLAVARGVVPVRDSKDPHRTALAFESGVWSSFVAAVKGEAFGA